MEDRRHAKLPGPHASQPRDDAADRAVDRRRCEPPAHSSRRAAAALRAQAKAVVSAAACALCVFAHAQPLPPAPEPAKQVKFSPPKVADIPNSPLGDMV